MPWEMDHWEEALVPVEIQESPPYPPDTPLKEVICPPGHNLWIVELLAMRGGYTSHWVHIPDRLTGHAAMRAWLRIHMEEASRPDATITYLTLAGCQKHAYYCECGL